MALVDKGFVSLHFLALIYTWRRLTHDTPYQKLLDVQLLLLCLLGLLLSGGLLLLCLLERLLLGGLFILSGGLLLLLSGGLLLLGLRLSGGLLLLDFLP